MANLQYQTDMSIMRGQRLSTQSFRRIAQRFGKKESFNPPRPSEIGHLQTSGGGAALLLHRVDQMGLHPHGLSLFIACIGVTDHPDCRVDMQAALQLLCRAVRAIGHHDVTG